MPAASLILELMEVYGALATFVMLVFLLLVAVSYVASGPQRRREREAQAALAELSCPQCGAPFGADAAHAAYHPPPRQLMIDDDSFHHVSVACPACGALSSYHRSGGEVELWRPHRPLPPALAAARRIGPLDDSGVDELVQQGGVRFVIEEHGKPFRPVSRRETERFWEWNVRGHVVGEYEAGNPIHFPGGYFYFAEHWTHAGGPMVLLQVTRAAPDDEPWGLDGRGAERTRFLRAVQRASPG